MKIDLSKLKKIESGDKHTILEHPNGHSIKIAHHGLSKEMKKQLDEIPLNLAKGGRAKYAQMHDPNMKGSKASGPSKSSNTMPGNAKMASKSFTEPDDIGANPPVSDMRENDAVVMALNKKMPPFGPLGTEKPHYPPCINSSCKSYGKPHPNCRCYGGNPIVGHGEGFFAEGGEVGKEKFCDANRTHFKGCEYFQDGGGVEAPVEIPKEDIPENTYQEADPSIDATSLPAYRDKPPTSQSPTESIYSVDEDSANQAVENAAKETMKNESGDKSGKLEEDLQDVRAADDSHSQPASGQTQNKAPIEPGPSDPYKDLPQDVNTPQYANALMHDESNKFYSDVDAGHIQPKTYHDLFAEKSLPGKIATIFGLLVGGAGSGMAHQDNALLKMMDNEISRDLQAQEKNAANKQSFLTINGNNLSHMAAAGKMGAETRDLNLAMAKDKMNYTFYNDLAQYAAKIHQSAPGSPSDIAAQQKLSLIKDAMINDKASGFAKAAGAYSLANQLGGGGSSNTTLMKSGLLGPEMKEVGADIEQKTFPGVPGRADRPIEEGDRKQVTAMNVLSKKASDLLDFAKSHKGTLSPKERALGAQKAEEMVNFYNGSLNSGGLTAGRLKWLDSQIGKNPTSIFQDILGNNSRLEEIKNSNDMRQNLLLNSYGMKGGTQEKSSSSTLLSKSGRPMVQKNGKWYYK